MDYKDLARTWFNVGFVLIGILATGAFNLVGLIGTFIVWKIYHNKYFKNNVTTK